MNLGAYLFHSDAGLRLLIFATVLVAMASAEAVFPARPRNFGRLRRWPANIVLTVTDTAMLRVVFPLLAVGAAVWAAQAQIGLFHWLGLPYWTAFAASLLALDALIYGQHVAMHEIGLLWRFHRVHHTDRDVDVTTAVRFHPGEIAFSMGLKMAVVVVLGAPPASVVAFEAILNGMAMFNHANLHLPGWLDRVLRWGVVTPDMHRIHHSLAQPETDSNYGFNLSLWDRLFRTYRKAASRADFTLGLEHFQSERPNGIGFVFALPFRGGPAR